MQARNKRLTRRTTGGLLIQLAMVLLVLTGCKQHQDGGDNNAQPIRIRAVYDRYLSFPVPSMGIEVQFNPPVLSWPPHEGNSTTKDVRLSQDSLFTDHTLEISATASAMYNPHRELSPGDWYWQYRITGTEW